MIMFGSHIDVLKPLSKLAYIFNFHNVRVKAKMAQAYYSINRSTLLTLDYCITIRLLYYY